jgi:hypothetical protein
MLAERQISHMPPAQQFWYGAAVSSGLIYLQRIRDIDTLFQEYQQLSKLPFYQKPFWIQISCDNGIHPIDTSLVEGSTYFRRLVQLVGVQRQQNDGMSVFSRHEDRRRW